MRRYGTCRLNPFYCLYVHHFRLFVCLRHISHLSLFFHEIPYARTFQINLPSVPVKIDTVTAMLPSQISTNFYPQLFVFIARFGWSSAYKRNMNAVLFRSCAFRKKSSAQRRQYFLWAWMTFHFLAYRGILWYFERRKQVGKACVLSHGVKHL